jgi:hypothetical protein
MSFCDMLQTAVPLGAFVRPDGERFTLNALIYETPPQYDYRLIVFDAAHETWGHMRLQAILPKRIAASSDTATGFVVGPILEQVKSCLVGANATSRPITPVFSLDGWVLV